MSDNRIVVKRQTARWDPDADVSVKEAMDFWSFAASAANVVMQLARPGVGTKFPAFAAGTGTASYASTTPSSRMVE